MEKIRFISLVFATLFITVPASAAVIDSNSSGFSLEFSTPIHAPVDSVYTALTDSIGEWWIDDHTWFGRGMNMQLNATAGGCFCEIMGDSQVQHMQVAMVIPNQMIRLIGGLGPLQGEGVSGVMEWRLQTANNTTNLTVFYRVGGYTPNDLSQWAAAVDGVLQQQMSALKLFVEQ